MKLLTKCVLYLLLLFFIEHITADQFISVILQRCYGTCNKKYCNVSIRCRPLNRTSKLFSMDFYFRPGLKLQAPINIELIVYKKFRTVYRQHMVKVKTELCAELNNNNKHPLFSRIFAVFKVLPEFDGNILDPCPLSGHRYITPFVPKHDHMPLIPVGEWKLEFIISKNINNSDELIVSWYEFYEIKPTSAIEF